MLQQIFRTVIAAAMPALVFGGPITFIFDYSGNTPGLGFLDPVDGPAREAALTEAGVRYSNLFGSYFSNTATITIAVTSFNDNTSATLASASSQFVSTPGSFGGGEVVRNKLLSNNAVDLNGASADGGLNVNWAYPYQIDPDAVVVSSGPGAQYDFFAVLYHEFTHALGIASEMYGDPASDRFGGGNGTPGTWAKWDQFLTDCAGGRAIDPGTFEINATNLANARKSGCFDGANGVSAYGGLVPLNPSNDLSHLNEVLLPTALMKPDESQGPEIRTWTATELGILEDIGYTSVPEPATAGFVLAGLVVVFAVRRRAASRR